MTNNKLRIIFMGTPEFAVPSLEAIVRNGHSVAAVVTRPDAPKGRGLTLTKSPVKTKAEELSIKVIDADNMKDPLFAAALKELQPDLFAVVAFRILPNDVLSIPRLGSYNVHPSLLPLYRGAAPIQWAIANGDKETGVSIFRLNSVIDGGDIIKQERFAIGDTETAGELSRRLSIEGADLLVSAINDIAEGRAATAVQNSTLATPAPKLKKEDGLINFASDSLSILNRLRGFNPAPGSYTFFSGKRVNVITADHIDTKGNPGEVLNVNADGITVAAGKGAIIIKTVKPEGRGIMAARDYANGNKITKGVRFGS
ncbi:MAG: methionyl-tRNA formyltransferase [Fibrobacteres bacterium]|nr:methionyl-tRNA formyltransferase [Fibrobacterota bacterium]